MKVIQALGLVVAAFASSVSAAPYTFTTLDFPGASSTLAFGINNAGQVVGRFSDSSGGRHGFINTGGTFTTLDVPGAGFTHAFGINNAGQVVGVFLDSSGGHGFIDTGGTFTTLDVPGASFTEAVGINNAGQVACQEDSHQLTAPGRSVSVRAVGTDADVWNKESQG